MFRTTHVKQKYACLYEDKGHQLCRYSLKNLNLYQALKTSEG